MSKSTAPLIQIGVSSCLLGEKVRYDGTSKKSNLVIATLSQEFTVIAFCPEMGIGLGTPREPIDLVHSANGLFSVRSHSDYGIDYSKKLRDYAQHLAQKFPQICGFVLKAKSPSCGIADTITHGEGGKENGVGQGLFTEETRRINPPIPVIDEIQFRDPQLRQRFIEAVKKIAQKH